MGILIPIVVFVLEGVVWLIGQILLFGIKILIQEQFIIQDEWFRLEQRLSQKDEPIFY